MHPVLNVLFSVTYIEKWIYGFWKQNSTKLVLKNRNRIEGFGKILKNVQNLPFDFDVSQIIVE